jgi:CcmD family protein
MKLTAMLRRIAGLGLALLLSAASLLAQAQDGFRAATPEDLMGESLPATPFVFVAYSVVWVLFFAYVFLLWRRLGRFERELADVRARLRPPAGG